MALWEVVVGTGLEVGAAGWEEKQFEVRVVCAMDVHICLPGALKQMYTCLNHSSFSGILAYLVMELFFWTSYYSLFYSNRVSSKKKKRHPIRINL